MTAEPVTFLAVREEAGERLDRVLARRLGDLPGLTVSRNQLQGWIEGGRVRINGKPATKPAARLAEGDRIEVDAGWAPRPRRAPIAEEMPLSILYEDEHFLALDKPAGVIVHPTPRQAQGTLWNGLLHLAREWGGDTVPGLVSRLDRDTSGVLLVAKRPGIHGALARALRSPTATKEYLAVAYGRVPLAKGRIDLEILRDAEDSRRMTTSQVEGEGLPSSTLYERLAEGKEAVSLLRLTLLTGRTHQIRVHLTAQGWPIVGDPVYGAPRWEEIGDPAVAAACREFPRQALHAWRSFLAHPVTRERLVIEAPVPADLAGLIVTAFLEVPGIS
jgi:23S rRNA pseudouridine1911/1915/1917 synthase